MVRCVYAHRGHDCIFGVLFCQRSRVWWILGKERQRGLARAGVGLQTGGGFGDKGARVQEWVQFHGCKVHSYIRR